MLDLDPARLHPSVSSTQACLAMLQTALRDDEPKSEPSTAPLDSEQAAALMTCMAQVDVHPRRKEFKGDTEVRWFCVWARVEVAEIGQSTHSPIHTVDPHLIYTWCSGGRGGARR